MLPSTLRTSCSNENSDIFCPPEGEISFLMPNHILIPEGLCSYWAGRDTLVLIPPQENYLHASLPALGPDFSIILDKMECIPTMKTAARDPFPCGILVSHLDNGTVAPMGGFPCIEPERSPTFPTSYTSSGFLISLTSPTLRVSLSF